MTSNAWVRLALQNEAISNEVAEDNAADATSVMPDNRGWAYGDGFFTTMGVIEGRILWQDYHVARLISHSTALQLDIEAPALIAKLQSYAKQLRQGILKLIVTRAPQAVRGYGYTPDSLGQACEIWLKSSALSIATSEYLSLPDGRTVFQQPAKRAICLSAQLACLPPTLAGLKTLNRLDSVLASGELQRLQERMHAQNLDDANNWGEGLVRDMSGQWVEGTMSNMFYQLSDNTNNSANTSHVMNSLTVGQWFTPPLTQSGVAGIMRDVIIDALAATDEPVIIRPLVDDDLPNLSQMFFCNAVRGVMPVSMLTLLGGEVVELSL